MKILRLTATLIVSALVTGSTATFVMPQAVQSFNFGKKKSADVSTAESNQAEGDAKDGDNGKPAEVKEKHKSKEEIKEEEELTAEYEAWRTQLNGLLKTVKTPFGSNNPAENKDDESQLGPLTLSGTSAGQSARASIRERLLGQPKLYMPGRMMIGRPVEFTIKGRPGYWAALAMADKDKGAKAIFGHAIRLGPDRKVVALGKIPVSGVLPLKIFAPIEGDLIGGQLFFEAAVWPENNPDRLELAVPVSSETQQATTANSVGIIGQGEKRRGLRFVPDTRSPYSQINGPGIGSGSL